MTTPAARPPRPDAPGATAKPRRRTQEERRASTRAALLDATIECLVQYGYADTTTTRVVERAGLSRGAQVHHFATKAALVAEAVRHLTVLRSEELVRRIRLLPERPETRLGAALDLLWAIHQGPLFTAAIELWVAARTDPQLSAALVGVERDVNQSMVEAAALLFGERAVEPPFQSSLLVAMAAMRGLALQDNAMPNRRSERARWHHTRERLLLLFDLPAVGDPPSDSGAWRGLRS